MTTATASSLAETIMPEALVAELLGIEVKTLRNQRSSGHGPVFIRRSGRGVLYYAADVEAYLLSRRTTPSGLSLPPQPKTVADVSALSAPTTDTAPVRRGPGRPAGAKNRPKASVTARYRPGHQPSHSER